MKELDRKRILPLNEKTGAITCIHHAYSCAIIESRHLVRVQVDNIEDYQLKSFAENFNVAVKDGLVSVLGQHAKEFHIIMSILLKTKNSFKGTDFLCKLEG